jgi:hypothetical protein
VVKGKSGYNIGAPVKEAVGDYLNDPRGSKALALRTCETNRWPLQNLVNGVPMEVSVTKEVVDVPEVARRLVTFSRDLEYKVFSTGSQGFYRHGKLKMRDGRRYQAQLTAVLIGSRDNPEVRMLTTEDEMRAAIGSVILTIEGKRFRTGRSGYYTSGKVTIGRERFQVGIQAVEIGSA